MTNLRNLLLLILVLASSLSAQAYQITIEKLSSLPTNVADSLVNIIPVKKRAQHYLIPANTGRIYLYNFSSEAANQHATENENNASNIVFDASTLFPHFVSLTAVTPHPNFTLRDQTGYLTIYTAHIEQLDTSRKRLRVADKQVPTEDIIADIVINEWQLEPELHVNVASQREIIRIGIPDLSTTINHLAFNHAVKMWHEDFGELYIGLNKSLSYTERPLYSGAILRIDPKRFGLRNYTVPAKNPHLQASDINDEILGFQFGDIASFDWSGKEPNVLIIDHKPQNQRQIASFNLINAKQNQPQVIATLGEVTPIPHQMLKFSGTQFSQLSGALLVSSQVNKRWQVMTVQPNIDSQIATFWPLDSDQAPQIFSDHFQSPLIFDRSNRAISTLVNIAIPGQDTTESFNEQQEGATEEIIVLAILLGALLWAASKGLKFILKQKMSISRFYHSQHTHFDVVDNGKIIHIFDYHQTTPCKVIDAANIQSMTIKLTNQTIAEISNESLMNNAIEEKIRAAFNAEKREKMVPNKLRHIQLIFTQKGSEETSVSLYLRKGDHRISKANYQMVIEQIIDTFWQLLPNTSQTREHSQHTTIVNKSRPIKAKIRRLNQVRRSPLDESSAGNSSQNESVKAKLTPTSQAPNKAATQAPNQATTPEAVIPNATVENAINNTVNNAQIDAQLVEALDKLVNLRKQNFLTDIEFEQAKAKLLKGLK
ncbi:SHOCT domain-containing protein [Colwellia sp. MEBiC06753]